MTMLLGTRRSLFGGRRATYIDKVLSYGPIAYWPLNETAGLTAVNYGTLGTAANGTYTGVTLANAVGPDGVNGAPFFDGANDYVNIGNATFLGAFDGSEGSAAGWIRVANAGVWTDGTERRYLRIEGAGGFVLLRRTNANTQLSYLYSAGGVTENINYNTTSPTIWIHVGITWSASADLVVAYLNGVPVGSSGTLGVFGAAPNLAIIGAESAVPARVWNGWMAHWAIFGQALSAPAMADLATG